MDAVIKKVFIMKRRILLFLFLILLIALTGCGCSNEKTGGFRSGTRSRSEESKASKNIETQNDRDIETLKEQYPEYFELSSFKGIEVYVWETADGIYRCGLMSGTNRMKTGAEIRALEQRSLSVAEAKTVLKENGIGDDHIIVIPVPQPYPDPDDTDISKPYIIDEEHAEQIYGSFVSK